MYTWMERHSNSLVGYKERASGLRDVLQEAVRFAMDRYALIITEAGELAIGPSRVTFTSKFEQAMSRDSRECIAAAKLLGRWFAKAGTTSTILSAWGVRP
jgi:hypothetical protein